MSIIDKAEETVIGKTPRVIEALGKIKFFLVVIPIICVVAGLLMQAVSSERNVGMVVFKMGSFATPANPKPVPLASNTQLKSRIRRDANELESTYPRSLIITTIIDNDVVSVTGTAKGPEITKSYLADVVQKEIDFQNGRLEKLQRVQGERRNSLESTLEELTIRVESLKRGVQSGKEPLAMFAMQQAIDNASARIASIKLELSTMSLLNASDLFIDTTQIIRPPFIIASSNWYRPVVFGAAGLAVGLLLTFLIAIIAIFRSLSRKVKKDKDRDHSDTETRPSLEPQTPDGPASL